MVWDLVGRFANMESALDLASLETMDRSAMELLVSGFDDFVGPFYCLCC